MKALIFGLFLAIPMFAFAQKPPVKFGDVSVDEVKMTVYDKDTSANAVVLADYGESTISYFQNVGFKLVFDRITRIKILKKDGLEWADFEIPLYKNESDAEKASNIKGATYNLENGKLVETKLKSDGIFKENRDANWDVMKITFPNVKEGSVVEITYTVSSEFLFNFQDWAFQTTIPVIWSEYRANIPEFFNYDKYTQGYIPLKVIENKVVASSINLTYFERSGGNVTTSTAHNEKIDFQENRFRWASEHVPAFKEEPYMTSYVDYLSKINFELSYIKMPNQPIKNMMGSWEDINKNFETLYREEIKGNGFLKKVVEEICSSATSTEQKISAIHNYVKVNVLWNGSSSKYVNTSLKKVLEEKKGNSAEINLILASMLEKADISVKPVLVSTRDHGLIRQATPASTQFNYVLCLVNFDDKKLLLDATERLLPVSMIPERCLNGTGLVVDKEAFSWINLESKFKTKTITSADLVLSPTAELSGKLKLDQNGYAALKKRKGYLIKGEEDYLKDLIGSHAWERKTSQFKNAEEIQNNFIEEHELAINENITATPEVVYLEPFLINGIKTNPFKSETREYPVDFGSPIEQMYIYKLTVPENFTIDEAPQSKIFMLPGNSARYTYNVVVAQNVVTITSILSINKSLFVQTDYPDLREFYNQVVAKQAEQIVLKKKL